MTGHTTNARKVILALAGIVGASGGLLLIFLAAFPYFFAESGSRSYARAHRGEAIIEVVAATALLWVAWLCFRLAMSPRVRRAVIAVLVIIWGLRSVADYTRTPERLQHLAGQWHVVVVPQPGEIDTSYYHLFYKRFTRFEPIQEQIGEYKFVAPDCMVFRGLKVVGRPAYAMCGFRIPVETHDTLMPESELLRLAGLRPRYRSDWRYNR